MTCLAPARPQAKSAAPLRVEQVKCVRSFPYWLDTHGRLYDPAARGWIRFRLWPAQVEVADRLVGARRLVVLKARQLGLTWLAVGFALWLMLYRPAATVLLFSQRDDEAEHLLKFRLHGMYDRLPRWMQSARPVIDNEHELRLSNGSAALAFPTTGGRSYAASFALVDEADHTPDLDRLLDAVKPTVDAGGRLLLLSTVDKARPDSPFKRIYEAACAGRNGYAAIFLPWQARPDRSAAWYAEIRRDFIERDGVADSLHGEYPATDLEALAGRTLDRRFAAEWLAACDGTGDRETDLPVYQSTDLPFYQFVSAQPGRAYVIAADPAEGNPQSDESAAAVLDAETAEQVAVLAGRFEPAVFAAGLARLSADYNVAPILVERNNHGHAVILWLEEHREGEEGARCGRLLVGRDGRPGWLTTAYHKALAFDAAADILRRGGARIRDRATLTQLLSIRGASLSAPPGAMDDRAVAFVLALAALVGLSASDAGSGESVLIEPVAVVHPAETGGW
jgi:hypothetical protein